jgi:hypothetical protein
MSTEESRERRALIKNTIREMLHTRLTSNALRVQACITFIRVRALEIRETWLVKLKRGEVTDRRDCPFGDIDAPISAEMLVAELPWPITDDETRWAWGQMYESLEALAMVAERRGIDSSPLRDHYACSRVADLDALERVCERLEVCEQLEAEESNTGRRKGGRKTNSEADRVVSAAIRQLREKGVELNKITRDRLIKETGVSAGHISGTNAWRALKAEQRESKARTPRSDIVSDTSVHERVDSGELDREVELDALIRESLAEKARQDGEAKTAKRRQTPS